MKDLRASAGEFARTTVGKMQLYLPNQQTRNVLLTPIKANILEAYGRLHMYLLAEYQPGISREGKEGREMGRRPRISRRCNLECAPAPIMRVRGGAQPTSFATLQMIVRTCPHHFAATSWCTPIAAADALLLVLAADLLSLLLVLAR